MTTLAEFHAEPTAIKQFDKANLKTLREDIDAALAQVAEKHGISLSIKNIRFDAANFRTQLEGATKGPTGEVINGDLATLREHGKFWLGDAFDANRAYRDPISGAMVLLVGLNMKRQKYPVIYKNLSNGKSYKTSIEMAKRMIASTDHVAARATA